MYTLDDLPITSCLATVSDDETLADVLSQMFAEGYTQIGVECDGDLTGVVTYESVVRTLLVLHQLEIDTQRLDRLSVATATEECVTLPAETDILSLFDVLAEDTYATFERGDEWRIVTDYDLLTALGEVLEPILLVESIERSLRALFRATFESDLSARLQETFDDDHPLPTPQSVEHCSFAHYAQFVSIHWDAFEGRFEDKQDIVRELIQAVGDVRNQLFHFRVDGETGVDDDLLRFAYSYFSRPQSNGA
jgi:hypothetical protein